MFCGVLGTQVMLPGPLNICLFALTFSPILQHKVYFETSGPWHFGPHLSNLVIFIVESYYINLRKIN